MSDTYREVHHWRCLVGREPCSLPTIEARKANWYIRRFTACYWQPMHNNGRHNWQPHTPKWYADHVWNNPQRVKVRDLGRKAKSEYNATGDTETELPTDQHRHGANWSWW